MRISKAGLSSDWSLQLDSMKLESLVIAHQPWRGEYVPGPCTHRPSSHESRGRLKSVTARVGLGWNRWLGLSRNKVAVPEGAAGTPPFWRNEYSSIGFVLYFVWEVLLYFSLVLLLLFILWYRGNQGYIWCWFLPFWFSFIVLGPARIARLLTQSYSSVG